MRNYNSEYNNALYFNRNKLPELVSNPVIMVIQANNSVKAK